MSSAVSVSSADRALGTMLAFVALYFAAVYLPPGTRVEMAIFQVSVFVAVASAIHGSGIVYRAYVGLA